MNQFFEFKKMALFSISSEIWIQFSFFHESYLFPYDRHLEKKNRNCYYFWMGGQTTKKERENDNVTGRGRGQVF